MALLLALALFLSPVAHAAGVVLAILTASSAECHSMALDW